MKGFLVEVGAGLDKRVRRGGGGGAFRVRTRDLPPTDAGCDDVGGFAVRSLPPGEAVLKSS